ncbi:MAG: hypothetical protein ACYCZR_00250 [Burkholderiales bacterium]
MRIVETDNFDGDYPDESFLLWPMPEAAAKEIADAVNRAADIGGYAAGHASRYWKVVPDNYVLQPGFEP